MPTDWTDAENDTIVADYFAMLADDIAGRPYTKAAHNRLLQAQTGRSHRAVEFKHQNISAVLQGLGEPWIPGYKPAVHIQASLIDAVLRWLDGHPQWLTPAVNTDRRAATVQLQEDPLLWIGPPPTQSNAPPPVELEQMLAIARKFGVAGRGARNRALGRASRPHRRGARQRIKMTASAPSPQTPLCA